MSIARSNYIVAKDDEQALLYVVGGTQGRDLEQAGLLAKMLNRGGVEFFVYEVKLSVAKVMTADVWRDV